MSSDDYQLLNIYRYSRKTYNKVQSVNGMLDDVISNPREDTTAGELVQHSPRSDAFTVASSPGCSRDYDPETEITNILHKKCPVITLAQQQLVKLLEETNKLVAENNGKWSSLYHCFCLCNQLVTWRNACQCVLMVMVIFAFFSGLLAGAATCGTYSRTFNNPILNCIDNFFVSDHYISIEDTYKSIA